MIRNYFKTAWRNITRNKAFSILNTIGLSVGMACFLLIMLFVTDELNYDRYNVNADRIVRIDHHVKFGDYQYNGAHTSAVMGPSFAKDFDQIQAYTRLKDNGGLIINKGADHVREDHVLYADSSLFSVFSLPMLSGNPSDALKEPNSMVITESTARKYFGTANVIGKTLQANEKDVYRITGVVKDVPKTSHFTFDFLLRVCMLEDSRGTSWFNSNFSTYLLLKKETNLINLETQFNKEIVALSGPQFKSKLNMSQDDFARAGNFVQCTLTPLTRIHLHSHLTDELDINGDVQYVYIFSAIAVFILLIACINFMNLSTARSSNRAREVGMRRCLAAGNTI